VGGEHLDGVLVGLDVRLDQRAALVQRRQEVLLLQQPSS